MQYRKIFNVKNSYVRGKGNLEYLLVGTMCVNIELYLLALRLSSQFLCFFLLSLIFGFLIIVCLQLIKGCILLQKERKMKFKTTQYLLKKNKYSILKKYKICLHQKDIFKHYVSFVHCPFTITNNNETICSIF